MPTIPAQASRFTIYELFCSGHPQALDLVRKIQEEHTMEWEAFEQRSSQLVFDIRNPISHSQTVQGQSENSALDDAAPSDRGRKRGYSMSSLDSMNMRSLHLPNNMSSLNLKHVATISNDGHAGREKASRLFLVDYLIKPVQRICRYPLLLDQLKIGKSIRSSYQEDGSSSASSKSESSGDSNALVESALQAMKHVASSVDEARRRQDIVTKSNLIATRISNAFATQSSSSSRSVVGHSLTLDFLSSLGACLLAGSMDVIHHHADKIPGSSGTVKAKYLGAFLYMGGYLVLVKVCKSKVYEPSHWFSLTGFEIADVPEEEGV